MTRHVTPASNTSRRLWLKGTLLLTASLFSRSSPAQSVEVPVRLQVELLSKVAAYDRNFAARAGARVQVIVIVKRGDPESERVGEQISAELSAVDQLGGRPHAHERLHFASAKQLAELCRTRGAAVVYLSTGLTEQIASVAAALEGISVLSVSATAAYVAKRAVLGFDVQAGKPKLVVHLDQARRQKVAFKPELLRLARVIQ
jgi:hypothetical protein